MKCNTSTCTYDKKIHPDLKEKDKFHRETLKKFHALAKTMCLEKNDYDIRTNKAGPAVCGEITLHTDNLYIQVYEMKGTMLVRTCEGRKDYTGGNNHFYDMELLDKPEILARQLQSFVKNTPAAKTSKDGLFRM